MAAQEGAGVPQRQLTESLRDAVVRHAEKKVLTPLRHGVTVSVTHGEGSG